MEIPNTNKLISLAYIVGILIVVLIIYRVLKSVGIVKSQARTKAKDKETALIEDLRKVQQFDVTYLDNRRDYKDLSGKAQDYAVMIRKALKGFGTDEESIFSVFGRLDSKDNITEIATVYKNKFDRDMLADILNDLNDKEKARLMTIINKLS
jgi:hypothetical protein